MEEIEEIEKRYKVWKEGRVRVDFNTFLIWGILNKIENQLDHIDEGISYLNDN